MYLYIERCDCELVTAYPYNEFPTQKLLSDIRYMIEQLEDTVLPELDILEQAITNADYAVILSYDGKALHSYMYCSLKRDDWESRIIYRDHFYDEENSND